MLNASFSQTTSSQTSVNIAVGQIVARHLNDEGIVQEREVFLELAPVPLLTSQISHPPAEADIYDFVPSNLSMPAKIANFWYFKMFPLNLQFFHESSVDSYSCAEHLVPDVKRSDIVN